MIGQVAGAIKWLIIGGILLGIVAVAWVAYSGVKEWTDEKCDAGDSLAQCIAEEGTISIGSLLFSGISGGVSGLFKTGKNIGNQTQQYNIFSNTRKIWGHYFG